MSSSLNLLLESVLSLAQGARELPPLRAGRPVHPTALWRWSKYGVNTPVGKIKLETVNLAGRVVTSREAIRRFLFSVAKAKAGGLVSTTAESPPRADRDHAAAKAKLDRIGVKNQ